MSKIENKPNLRQFVVIKEQYDDGKWKQIESFTTDSFREAIEIAYEHYSHTIYDDVHIAVYEADGKLLVCDLKETNILTLYKLRHYLI